MSKITKKQLQESHNKLLNQFASLVRELKVNNVIDDSVCPTFTKKTEPHLKQLDQSVFDGEPEQIKWAMVTSEGAVLKLEFKPVVKDGLWYWIGGCRQGSLIGQYDASNWQNSLIERDIAKELTGSELCKAMLARGDKYVMCGVSDVDDADAASNEYDDLVSDVVTDFDCKDGLFGTVSMRWSHAVPINNQGEPLTASEVGL